MTFRIKSLRIISPHAKPLRNYIPTMDKLIQDTIKKQINNVIFVDGRGQSGKSTFADYKAKEYDQNYYLMYTIEDLFKLLEIYRKKLEIDVNGKIGNQEALKKIQYKWIFWDEPQNETINTRFWDERFYIAGQLTSAWGFLKQQLIIATPDTANLPHYLMRNVTCKVSIKVFLRGNEIIRKYFVYIAKKNPKTNKWYWGFPIQSEIIPKLELPVYYWERKLNNFFNVQLEKWKENIMIDKNKRNWFIRRTNKPLDKNEVLKLFSTNRIEYSYAYEQLTKGGLNDYNATLLLDNAII